MKIDITIETERGVKLEAHAEMSDDTAIVTNALPNIVGRLITLMEKSHDEQTIHGPSD